MGGVELAAGDEEHGALRDEEEQQHKGQVHTGAYQVQVAPIYKGAQHLRMCDTVLSSVAEQKLFIFGSGSTYVSYFGSGFDSSSNSCHIVPLKTVQ